ncbi:hypothetical protein CSOJ01_02262 [Colletotrichum sojae]|uniref:Uncharacterized protein n=1 Tax=Colletotrichum sojae TaxID=2175907 RepID=A0A8H6JRH6_9PEZI|nr:hypothetical protein CSOJ01_02262 [Colletotrichum sojae]
MSTPITLRMEPLCKRHREEDTWVL